MSKIERLKIYGYKDPKFQSKAGTYAVPINPESFKHEMANEYAAKSGAESGGQTTQYKTQTAQRVSFTLYFDATGVVPGMTSVSDELRTFKSLAYDYHGSIHSPYYLKLVWGTFEFKCRLTSMNLDYTLFKPNGTPLRATANVQFEEFLSAEGVERKENNQSPDVTHVRTIRAGDLLPLLCHEIYGDSRLYLKVARHNGLNDFRNLSIGTQIVFPSLAD